MFAVLLAAAITAPAAVSVATAQSSSPTPTATPDETESFVASVDDRLRVESYRYDEEGETFYLTLSNTDDEDSGATSEVTVTEAISPEQGGAGSFGIETVSVDPGETVEVEVSVSREGIRGVMITTVESVESGTGTYIAADSGGGDGLIDGRATGGDVRSGVLATLVASLLLSIVGAWHYVAQDNRDVRDADLDVDETPWGGFKDE